MDDFDEEISNTKFDVLKKIAIWILVFLLSIMLLAIFTFQPTFFTFVD